MARGYALEVWIVDGGDNTIKVGHTFYGLTEAECRTYYAEHLESCEYFAAAEKDGRVWEELLEVDELPAPEDFETEDDLEED